MNEARPQVGDLKYYEMLEQLQALDFVLVELNLFLDTHPNDLKSIEQFNKLTQERTVLAKQFQELYGPAQNFGRAYSKYPFEWAEGPGLGRFNNDGMARGAAFHLMHALMKRKSENKEAEEPMWVYENFSIRCASVNVIREWQDFDGAVWRR